MLGAQAVETSAMSSSVMGSACEPDQHTQAIEREGGLRSTAPITALDPVYSSSGAQATPWTEACTLLEQAEIFWLATIRPEGCPHVTPVLAVWLDDALYFCTGEHERKAKNLARNPRCTMTTGCNTLNQPGLDLVVEGAAVRVHNEALLWRVAAGYESKYGSAWRFTVRDGAFYHASAALHDAEVRKALVYRVAPTTAFGFGKGTSYSQTRWRFGHKSHP
jgi:hypothetical protein